MYRLRIFLYCQCSVCVLQGQKNGVGENLGLGLGQDRLLSRYLYHPYHVCGVVSGITQIFDSIYCLVSAWMAQEEIQVLREDPAMSP